MNDTEEYILDTELIFNSGIKIHRSKTLPLFFISLWKCEKDISNLSELIKKFYNIYKLWIIMKWVDVLYMYSSCNPKTKYTQTSSWKTKIKWNNLFIICYISKDLSCKGKKIDGF